MLPNESALFASTVGAGVSPASRAGAAMLSPQQTRRRSLSTDSPSCWVRPERRKRRFKSDNYLLIRLLLGLCLEADDPALPKRRAPYRRDRGFPGTKLADG